MRTSLSALGLQLQREAWVKALQGGAQKCGRALQGHVSIVLSACDARGVVFKGDRPQLWATGAAKCVSPCR